MNLHLLNNGFGPLYRKRSDTIILGISIVTLIFFHISMEVLVGFNFSSPLHYLLYYSSILSSLLMGELIRKMTLFVQEFRHLKERYDGSKGKALKKCLNFGKSTKVVYLVFFITTAFSIFSFYDFTSSSFPPHIYITYACSSSLLLYLVGAKTLSDVESSHLSETENKNIADGLAWGFYYGYLKLILPNLNSTIEKALLPDYKIDDDDMRNKISVNKVFIVISKKCSYQKNFFGDEGSIEAAGTLPEYYLTRGGVELRPYKHTIYKVAAKGKNPIYIPLEYATPLLTMNDMSDDKYAEFSREDRDAQIVEFYNKLKSILDRDEAIRDRYQLILIEDPAKGLAEVLYNSIYDSNINIS